MTDRVPHIADIADRKSLAVYLQDRPIAEAQVLALRSAIRVMPLIVSPNRRLTLETFKAALFSWSARSFPAYEKTFLAVASQSLGGGGVAVAGSARGGVPIISSALVVLSRNARVAVRRAARSADPASAALAVASVASIARTAATDATGEVVWHAIASDLVSMRHASVGVCLTEPIWPQGRVPHELLDWEVAFRSALDAFSPDWQLIYTFYQALRDGVTPFARLGEEVGPVMLALAQEDGAFWARKPDIVMRDLAERLETRPQPEAASNKLADNINFFISYSTKNEAEAREINGYLEDAGYSTIVQLKDFVPGSNFVTEMQKGLNAKRFMALLSPAYFSSKQCQAEWSAAYNRDPSGELRYLVPILIEKTELPPLAKQIVYKSIVGLSGDARRNAVLEAIGKLKRSEVPGIRSPYEFELTPRHTITAVAGTMNSVSVLPGRDPGDARRRLEAARDIAIDLIGGLAESRFQVGHHYKKELENYRDRLPMNATESIYSADAALRNLRDDLESDLRYGIVCDRFAPRLQRLIEAHYGLRVYFPELLSFYDDVKQARQAEPPPLEALSELRKVVQSNTPAVFDTSVGAAFGHAVDVAHPAKETQEGASSQESLPSAHITLPPDPIAGVDPVRAAQHAEMSMQNRIWAVLRRVEEGGKTAERIDKAVSAYAKWIDPILDWLSNSS
ncbi:toll/interleukin-1 receptor domain-containing protein [Rhizobium oryzicola]|uniref:Toll/interleukin-1 receptor domain-containing protein n=1 Tax=Rhizobium oryzicola TaxID=1232668 RepID=A0ABT8SVB4_9HYPH|nr:toll/interleukin-1 receptor domain-containing protein [Rhizobium oryzicola]MDO1582384.1 toll/interleukin-1 receptor domain-containing protein [Rhizobium oryzicola]